MGKLIWVVFCLVTLFLNFIRHVNAGGVDLHAHLFMKEGLGCIFKGSFREPLQAKSWEDRFSSQVNDETLLQSNLDLVIATLYAHPLFNRSLRDSIRNQISMAQKFVAEHPQWILAEHPDQAKSALESGKHVMVLALEGASGILENEADIEEFVDRSGIRIVAPLHLTDDPYGGVAFLKGFRAISSPIAFLKNMIVPVRDLNGIRINSQGLTPFGIKMTQSLVRHKVWIDLSHASDASQNELIALMIKARQPLLYTHTVLRHYLHAERGISDLQLLEVQKSRGLVGLVPSEEMLDGTPGSAVCSGSINALALQFHEATEIVGDLSVGIGSDFNGAIQHLKPSCKPTQSGIDLTGLWNIGQSEQLWKALRIQEVLPSSISKKAAFHFTRTWSRLWAP